ncbi:MAG: T9SS type A sorting domain-containing protein [Chlorobi bacterium]|nr:T9SS type A sorting domain-containing protein [Chlorobiota bacterium]
MVKYHHIKRVLLSNMILAASFVFFATYTMAGDYNRSIIVSGQVINYEYGNPVEGHSVIIESIKDVSDREYYKELITDDEGYYRDTIYTNLNKGSFKISTLDYKGQLIDTTVHYRFLNYAAFNFIIANFSIYMPFHTQVLQAKFRYYQRNNDNRFKFSFRDLTDSEDIVSWFWDFGDGDTSALQNPDHIYMRPGVYKVKFKVTAGEGAKTESNTISSLIYISDRSYFHMGGHTFAGYFPIDKGLAYLYIIDSNLSYIPVDTVKFDTLGFYIFYQIPAGKYLVKTQADEESEFYGDFIPTYYGDNMFWEDAAVVELNNTGWEYDIHLIQGVEMTNGNCSLDGNVVYSDPESVLGNIPAELVDLYLVDGNNTVFLSHYSDEKGYFDFSNLPTGKYWIYPELTGIETKKMHFELTDEKPSVTDIQIIIGPSGPDFIFEYATKESIINNLYPNPATNIVNVSFNNNDNSGLNIELIDLSGKVVFSEKVNVSAYDKNTNINVSDFKSGLYILKISNNKSFDSRMLVVD